jgi:hypothetical protein
VGELDVDDLRGRLHHAPFANPRVFRGVIRIKSRMKASRLLTLVVLGKLIRSSGGIDRLILTFFTGHAAADTT